MKNRIVGVSFTGTRCRRRLRFRRAFCQLWKSVEIVGLTIPCDQIRAPFDLPNFSTKIEGNSASSEGSLTAECGICMLIPQGSFRPSTFVIRHTVTNGKNRSTKLRRNWENAANRSVVSLFKPNIEFTYQIRIVFELTVLVSHFTGNNKKVY